jgi:hypothetical protein
MFMETSINKYRPLDEMTFRQAAVAILKAADKPLHYFEITQIAIETGYWRKQDEEYIKEHMYQAIKTDLRKKKFNSMFTEIAPGTYTVNESALRDLEQ